MKFLRLVLLTFLFTSSMAIAAPASEDTIRQLMVATKMRSTIERMQDPLKDIMHMSVQQALKGRVPTPKQQEAIDKLENNTLAAVQKELDWGKLEPTIIHLYQESFTEEEVIGMLNFYETPAGQAVINKMPTLMQKMMLNVQAMQQRLEPEMQRIQQEFISDIAAASK